MKLPCSSFYCLLSVFLFLSIGNVIASAFFIKWPWSYYPGLTQPTLPTSSVSGTLNYGFIRPAVIVQVPTVATTTTAATTTTTTTTTTRPPTTLSPTQILINALLASSQPVNNSLLLTLANALSNRPVIGGVAQPFPITGGIAGGALGGIAGLQGFQGIQSPAAGGISFPASAAGIAGQFGGVGGIAGQLGGLGGIAGQLGGLGGIAGQLGGIGGIAGPAGGQIVLPNGFPAGGGVISSGVLPPGLFPGIIGKSAHARARSSGRIVFGSKRK